MKILSIETSCDETAVCVLKAEGSLQDAHFTVLGDALYSQAKKHAQYGGVYPTLAKREHALNLTPLLKEALLKSKLSINIENELKEKDKEYIREILKKEPDMSHSLIKYLEEIEKPKIDAIAVTQGPGLEPALWVGINFARALAYVWDLPIIPVNHLEGHIFASAVEAKDDENKKFEITDISFPVLGLVVSGGHTEFIYSEKWGEYKIVGRTRDDSIGEAFDKVARLLGIPYPGGPELSRLADTGRKISQTNPADLANLKVELPRPMLNSDDLDFSFSGLKTAVLYKVQDMGELSELQKKFFAMEFENATTDVVIKKTKKALQKYTPKTFILGGGVSANKHIRNSLEQLFKNEVQNCKLLLPASGLSTDNAVMIGMAGYFMHLRKAKTLKATDDITAFGNMSVE
jgi:N6-L-threonylcarbamoyladenine synthase